MYGLALDNQLGLPWSTCPRSRSRALWRVSFAAFYFRRPATAIVRLRLSFQLPLTGTLGVNLVRLKEVVARDTSNAVAIEILHGKEALPDRTVAKLVMAGDIEMATANVVTLADKVKGVDVLSLPFLFNSHAFLKAMLDPSRRSRRLLDDAILKTGARVLMWQPYGTNVFFSKGEPASTPAGIATSGYAPAVPSISSSAALGRRSRDDRRR